VSEGPRHPRFLLTVCCCRPQRLGFAHLSHRLFLRVAHVGVGGWVLETLQGPVPKLVRHQVLTFPRPRPSRRHGATRVMMVLT
jgi:hypothetical protein